MSALMPGIQGVDFVRAESMRGESGVSAAQQADDCFEISLPVNHIRSGLISISSTVARWPSPINWRQEQPIVQRTWRG
jgi:hypothetical protein